MSNILAYIEKIVQPFQKLVQYLFSFRYTNVVAGIMVLCVVLEIVGRVSEWYHYRTGAYFKSTGRKRTSLTARNGGKCENEAYEALRVMEKEGWKFLFDLYIPNNTAYGTTTEIDGLAIGPGGIVAIECKDYSGKVIGREFDREWEQEKEYLSNPQKAHRWFYNPIMQNDGHIRCLSRLLGTNGKKYPVKSLVVFSDKTSLYVPTLSREDVFVTQVKYLKKNFGKLVGKGTIMDQKEVEETFAMLSNYTGVSKEVRDRHIAECRQPFLQLR